MIRKQLIRSSLNMLVRQKTVNASNYSHHWSYDLKVNEIGYGVTRVDVQVSDSINAQMYSKFGYNQ